MNKKVFLSYSWKDNHIAVRLYNDLVRSKVSIWRDQIDGNPIADFEKEFLQAIDECDYFIMLDSINYREKSKWCCEEIERCLINPKKLKAPNIIVCLLDEDGEWRIKFKNEHYKDVFSQINRLKYQKLYYDNYDNDNVYDTTLNFICGLLGVSYERWDKIPSYQDFIDELKSVEKTNKFDENTSMILLNEYKNILLKINKNYSSVKDSFKIWISDCKESGISLFFPQWTYSVWLVNQEKYNIEEVYKAFWELKTLFPEDPRSCRGLGNVSAIIGNNYLNNKKLKEANYYYAIAEKSLLEAENLIYLDSNQRHKQICEFEILTNIGQIYYNTGKYAKALDYFEKSLVLMKRDKFFFERLVQSMFVLKKLLATYLNEIIDWLTDLLKIYPVESILYQLLGLCYCEIGLPHKAKVMLEQSYLLNPTMENLFYLVNIKSKLGILDNNTRQNVLEIINNADKTEQYWINEIKKRV